MDDALGESHMIIHVKDRRTTQLNEAVVPQGEEQRRREKELLECLVSEPSHQQSCYTAYRDRRILQGC